MIEDEDDDCDNEDGWSGDNEKGKRSEKPKKMIYKSLRRMTF